MNIRSVAEGKNALIMALCANTGITIAKMKP